MMKAAIAGAAMMFAAPGFAADATAVRTTGVAPQAGAGSSGTVAPLPQTSPPVSAAPTDPTMQPTQQAAEAGEPVTGAQIAEIVEAEFPKYDREGNGELTEAQFSEWLVALRVAGEPGATADRPDVKAWARQAFAQADIDRSQAVSKAELTSFLSQGAG